MIASDLMLFKKSLMFYVTQNLNPLFLLPCLKKAVTYFFKASGDLIWHQREKHIYDSIIQTLLLLLKWGQPISSAYCRCLWRACLRSGRGGSMSAAPPLLHVTVYTHRLMNTHLGCSSGCVTVYSPVMRCAVCDLEAGLCVHVLCVSGVGVPLLCWLGGC